MSATQKSNTRVINLSLHSYFNTQHMLLQFLLTFITLFQSCSSNIQGLCYQTPICCFIWNFCVQTAIHFQQYKPSLFFKPQYLERQCNQPKKRMVSQIKQKHIPFKIKTTNMLCICLMSVKKQD